MTAYFDTTEAKLVDAEPAELGTRVLCGPLHATDTVTQAGDWIVLTPGLGYEVWANADFRGNFVKCGSDRGPRLEKMLADTSRLRRLALAG